MCTSSWNSGNHVCAFEMMDFKNDTFFWCSASLSAISLRCLACISINCRWCSSCCRCICCCNSSMLSSRAVTLLCRAWLSASNSLSLPKRTNFCHKCGFRFRLGCFQLLRLDFLLNLIKLLFRLLPIDKQSCAERRKMKQGLLNLHFHRVMIRKPFFCFNLL